MRSCEVISMIVPVIEGAIIDAQISLALVWSVASA